MKQRTGAGENQRKEGAFFYSPIPRFSVAPIQFTEDSNL
jgi:hypothetical protein